MDFQPSSFVGAKQGYEFKTAEQGTGYYKRSAPISTEPPRAKLAKADSDNGPVPGLKPPVLKPGDYVLCAYYTRDIFIVKQLRKSLTKPHYWSYEIANPRLLGNYNWVAERYLVSYHPPQGELNPDRTIEWFIGEHGTLDQSLPMERKSRRNEYHPSRLLASSIAHSAAATSSTGNPSAGQSTEDTVVLHGHALRVACTNPPLVPIRDLIALICDMDPRDKGSLNTRNSFFDRGFGPQLRHRFAGSQFDTPVFEWSSHAIDGTGGLLEFCSNSGSGRLAKKIESFRNSDAWTELEQKVLQAAGAAATHVAEGANLATSKSGPGSGTIDDNARVASRDRRSLSSSGTGSATMSSSSHHRRSSNVAVGSDSGSTSNTATFITSPAAFQAAQSDELTAITSSLFAAAAAAPAPASANPRDETASPSSSRARACSGGDLIGRKVAKQYHTQGTVCWYYGDVINTFTGEGKQRYYKVRFDDGDVQDFSLLELRHILVDEATANGSEQPGVAEEVPQRKAQRDSQSLPAATKMGAEAPPAFGSKGDVFSPGPPQQHAADVDLLMNLVS